MPRLRYLDIDEAMADIEAAANQLHETLIDGLAYDLLRTGSDYVETILKEYDVPNCDYLAGRIPVHVFVEGRIRSLKLGEHALKAVSYYFFDIDEDAAAEAIDKKIADEQAGWSATNDQYVDFNAALARFDQVLKQAIDSIYDLAIVSAFGKIVRCD